MCGVINTLQATAQDAHGPHLFSKKWPFLSTMVRLDKLESCQDDRILQGVRRKHGQPGGGKAAWRTA